jgi:hypothetical protein
MRKSEIFLWISRMRSLQGKKGGPTVSRPLELFDAHLSFIERFHEEPELTSAEKSFHRTDKIGGTGEGLHQRQGTSGESP